MILWTTDEINRILLQLDERKLPFKQFSFVREGDSLNLLGRGGSANVYEAESRAFHVRDYAIKVIGFNKPDSDSDLFLKSCEAQKKLFRLGNDTVVTVHDYCELFVVLDAGDNVIEVLRERPSDSAGRILKLQFLVMDKFPAVVTRTKAGNLKLINKALADSDETEVLKLAYDIGNALERAHNRKILHRDVKLENVFYDEKAKQYKLGDFGIAKVTDDGFAGTIAFTKGYAAPEVRAAGEQYDNTADIYSFGMMLYVLMNGMKFPDSKTYNVNSNTQYKDGYVVPRPEGNISDAFYEVIAKACMYYPDDRYQSMKEMISAIEGIMYQKTVANRKLVKNDSLALGCIFTILGIILINATTVYSELITSLPAPFYLFFGACILDGILISFKKQIKVLRWIIAVLGVSLLLIYGRISILYAVMLIIALVVLTEDRIPAYFSACVIALRLAAPVLGEISFIKNENLKYGWAAFACFSFGCILLINYEILAGENRFAARFLFGKGLFWKLSIGLYGFIFFIGATSVQDMLIIMSRVVASTRSVGYQLVKTTNIAYFGAAGIILCIYWLVRERMIFAIKDVRNE